MIPLPLPPTGEAASLHDPRTALRPEVLQRVYLVFLYRGPAYTASPETPQDVAIVDAHAAYVWDLYQRGVAIAAGPVLGGLEPADLVSMSVLRAQTAGEAERLAYQDPAVQCGRFRAVVRPWLLPAGV